MYSATPSGNAGYPRRYPQLLSTLCVTYIRVVSPSSGRWGRQIGRYPPKGMNFSTPVDNFVPVSLVDVDKRRHLGPAVDNPVIYVPQLRVSTGLSTLLITYTRVVQGIRSALSPGIVGISAEKPTSFPHLWITCEQLAVIKWVTSWPPWYLPRAQQGSVSVERRTRRAADVPRINPGQIRQSYDVEHSVKLRALSTAQYTVGKTVLTRECGQNWRQPNDPWPISVDVHRVYPRLWIKLRTSVDKGWGSPHHGVTPTLSRWIRPILPTTHGDGCPAGGCQSCRLLP
ncbi:hypothetical protein ABIE35_002617 [Paenarthrobacter sp. 4246]